MHQQQCRGARECNNLKIKNTYKFVVDVARIFQPAVHGLGGGAAEPPPLPWALLLRPAGGWVDVGEEPLPEVFCAVFGAGTPNSTCNMILAKYEEGSSFKIVAMVRSRLLFGKQRMERKKGNEVTNVVW